MSFSDALAELFVLILVSAIGLPSSAQSVTTSQYDNARRGANQHETILTPRNVDVRHFGKQFTLKVDGDVYAQPLFLTGLDIPGKGRPLEFFEHHFAKSGHEDLLVTRHYFSRSP